MFMDSQRPTFLLAPEERNVGPSDIAPKTLRSAGGRSAFVTDVYKHLAPLEPEPLQFRHHSSRFCILFLKVPRVTFF